MSVLVVVKFTGDTDTFQKALADRGDEFAKVADRGRAAGAIHHRFGLGDGHVIVVDEWQSAEQFEKFFGEPDLQAFIASAGADLSAPPDISITEAIATPDQF
jgi:quinol monooxygenase YgiN